MHSSKGAVLILVCALAGCSTSNNAETDQESSVRLARQAVFANPGSSVPEVSTEVLEQILKDQSAVVLDTRPYLEWSISHIPGALNVGTDKLTSRLVKFSVYARFMRPPHISKTQRRVVGKIDSVWPISNAAPD